MQNQAVVIRSAGLPVGLYNVMALWVDRTTDPASPRRKEFVKAKGKILLDFFQFTDRSPDRVKPEDIKAWQLDLEKRGLSQATIYARVSRVSSFFTWAADNDQLGVKANPVAAARPKPPRAYTSDKARSLPDEAMDRLLALLGARQDVVGKRDYALLLFFLITGWRRSEVIGLRWGDLQINQGLVVNVRVKGGQVESRAVESVGLKDAILDYLQAAGRLDGIQDDSPLWTRHDRAGKPGKALTSHAFAKNLKRYAGQVGLDHIHLHQTRHTVARWAGEELGSLTDVQHVLGHKNLATTKVYLEKVGVKSDKVGKQIAHRLGVE